MYDNLSFSPVFGHEDSPEFEDPYVPMTNSQRTPCGGGSPSSEVPNEDILCSLTNALKYVSKSKRPSAPKFSIGIFSGQDGEDPFAFVKRFKLLAESQMWDDEEGLKYLAIYDVGLRLYNQNLTQLFSTAYVQLLTELLVPFLSQKMEVSPADITTGLHRLWHDRMYAVVNLGQVANTRLASVHFREALRMSRRPIMRTHSQKRPTGN